MRSGASHVRLGSTPVEDEARLDAYAKTAIKSGYATVYSMQWSSIGQPTVSIGLKDGTWNSFSIGPTGQITDKNGNVVAGFGGAFTAPPAPTWNPGAGAGLLDTLLIGDKGPPPPQPPDVPVIDEKAKTNDPGKLKKDFVLGEGGIFSWVPKGNPKTALEWLAIMAAIALGLYALDWATKD